MMVLLQILYHRVFISLMFYLYLFSLMKYLDSLKEQHNYYPES